MSSGRYVLAMLFLLCGTIRAARVAVHEDAIAEKAEESIDADKDVGQTAGADGAISLEQLRQPKSEELRQLLHSESDRIADEALQTRRAEGTMHVQEFGDRLRQLQQSDFDRIVNKVADTAEAEGNVSVEEFGERLRRLEQSEFDRIVSEIVKTTRAEELSGEQLRQLQRQLDDLAAEATLNASANKGLPADAALLQRALQARCIDNRTRLHAVSLLFHARMGVVGKTTLFAAVLFFLGYTGPAVGMEMLGFAATGVVRGSIAALIQWRFPFVTAPAWFAWARSMGMTMTGGVWTAGGSWILRHQGAWILRRQLAITSDRQLFGAVLDAGLFDDDMRSLLEPPSAHGPLALLDRFRGA